MVTIDEKLIEKLTALKSAVESMTNELITLEAILKREETHVAEGQFSLLEGTAKEKLSQDKKIKSISDEFLSLQAAIISQLGDLHQGQPVSGKSVTAENLGLKSLIALVESYLNSSEVSGLKLKVAQFVSRSLVDKFTEFENHVKRVYPLMEKNSYLVSKALEHSKASYQFWQEMAAESAGSYSSGGKVDKSGSSAAFKVQI